MRVKKLKNVDPHETVGDRRRPQETAGDPGDRRRLQEIAGDCRRPQETAGDCGKRFKKLELEVSQKLSK